MNRLMRLLGAISLISVFVCAMTSCQWEHLDESDNSTAGPVDDDDNGDPPDSVGEIEVVLPSDVDPAVKTAAEDVVGLLGQVPGMRAKVSTGIAANPGVMTIAVVGNGVGENLFTTDELTQLPPESFRLRQANLGGANLIAIAGGDARGQQYGLYDLLERLGFRFFHPEQTYIPVFAELQWPKELDVFEQPDWQRRGFHFHTMHPIEASEFLQVSSEQHLEWAKHLIDWLARNKQNYWQFELLRTVDYDQTVPYFQTLVDYSHSRLVDAGVVVTWVFQQQKAWKLLPDARGEHLAELQTGLDQIMQVRWDHLNLEMGGTEFTKVEDTLQVAWMDNTVAYLAENYPNTDASVKVHCSSDQTAPNYGNINFNYLPQEADSRMGIYPHTVMYYSLSDPAPVYNNEDFSQLYDWMLSMIDGVRKVYYYPETAYWCSFDIDVPSFLPIYIFSRWSDMALLVDQGLDGHVDFTSGHEWSYWLNDWAVARFTWDSRQDWKDTLAMYATMFGNAGPELASAVADLAMAQKDFLIDRNLASYLAGQDTWDELGYLFGTTTHPEPMQFAALYRLDEAGVRDFANTVLADLAEMAISFEDLAARVSAVQDEVPGPARSWFEELQDSFEVDRQRATHARLLWAGAVARRLNELGVYPEGENEAQTLFSQAQDITAEFRQTIARRELAYRYPIFYSSGWKRSVTSYDFRYLYQASTAYWFVRYEKQAIDKNFNPFLMNIIDPIWFFF